MNINKFIKKDRPLFDKVCEFPECGVHYQGTQRAKYCHEHRKGKYRKVIDKEKNDLKKREMIENNQNVTINHSYNVLVNVLVECECCSNKFQITILPDVFVYPKYCEEHRNEYRRNLYLKQMGIIVEMPKKEIEVEDLVDMDKELTDEEIKQLIEIDEDIKWS